MAIMPILASEALFRENKKNQLQGGACWFSDRKASDANIGIIDNFV